MINDCLPYAKRGDSHDYFNVKKGIPLEMICFTTERTSRARPYATIALKMAIQKLPRFRLQAQEVFTAKLDSKVILGIVFFILKPSLVAGRLSFYFPGFPSLRNQCFGHSCYWQSDSL